METREAHRKKPIRISTTDYIASLVRLPSYVNAYKSGGGIYPPSQFHLKPIPPDEAKKDPKKFIKHLVPPVVMETNMISQWNDGESFDPPTLYDSVLINFSRSDDEIIEGLKNILQDVRIENVRSSCQRDKTLAKGTPDRWKVWDTFIDQGHRNKLKTARVLFPDIFDDRLAEKELADFKTRENHKIKKMVERARNNGEKYLMVGGKNRRLDNVYHFYEKKFDRMKATPERQIERKKYLTYIARQIVICRKMINAHVSENPFIFF
jgi:hypothetical protein